MIIHLTIFYFIGISGIWGVLAIGLFADDPKPLKTTSGRKGVLKGSKNCLTVLNFITFEISFPCF